MTPLAHIPQLDGLRGLACLMVLVSHSLMLPAWFGEHFGDIGMHGVRIFMVLSGFLITRILLRDRTRDHRWQHFVIHRMTRLLPAFYLCVLGTWLVWRQPIPLSTVFYLMNYQNPSMGLQHTATLAVEEQFYLIWPLVVFWLAPGASRRVISAAIAASLGLAAFRAWTDSPIWGIATYVWLEHCVVLFGAGALIASYEEHARTRWTIATWLTVTTGLIIAIWWLTHWRLPAVTRLTEYLTCSLVAILAVAVVLRGPWLLRTVLTWPALTAVGAISYGLYLYHYPIFFWYHDLLHHWRSWPALIAMWAVSLGVAAVSFRYFERPVMYRLRALASRSTARSLHLAHARTDG